MPNPQLPTADECERIFRAALGQGDMRGVEAALLILAVQDPRRADTLMKDVKAVLDFVAAVDAGKTQITRADLAGWAGDDRDDA